VRVQRYALAASYPGKDQVLIVQEAGWASGSVWTGAENLASTGIRSPDRPARRQSLYQYEQKHLNATTEYLLWLRADCWRIHSVDQPQNKPNR